MQTKQHKWKKAILAYVQGYWYYWYVKYAIFTGNTANSLWTLYLVINNDAKEWVYTSSCAHAPMQTPS